MLKLMLLLLLISFVNVVHSDTKDIIVSYNGYYSTKFRQNLLPKTFITKIQARPIEFSDFDLVKIESGNFENFTRAISKIKVILKISEDKTHFRNLNGFKKVSLGPNKFSSKHYLDIRQIADLIRADRLWMKGFMGEGIDIAVFDTGITRRRTFFKNVKSIYDFTNEGNSADLIGHGTFVAGLIASSRRRCSGIAPKSNLHIYKVFTNQQLSTTSWFLDAFNMALQSKIHIINLSIGGPDFTDEPFMSKVHEITSNGIIIISAIGNDGPVFGTLNNPADQGDVIGVGGINLEEKIAKFSSRGMTTWELPEGYGRIKPDIVTYGSQIFGPSLYGGCRSLSGTSVAAPVITGAVAILLSSIPEERRRNPAMIKQILAEGAKKLETNASMFEQGSGKLDLPASFYYLQKYLPKISFFPSYIDYLECPYMWPYCSQPIYSDGLPTIFNITIFNGYGIGGEIINELIFEPFEDDNGAFLDVHLEYSHKIWPWSGHLAIFVKIKPEASNFNGTSSAQIRLKVKTTNKIHETIFKFRVKIIPTPLKSQRILWDQFRQMRYPPGYFARDNLEQKNSPLDWNADHPHTNFKDLYEHLRGNGYFIEISGYPLICINLSSYSMLVIVDPEEEYFPAEINAIQMAVKNDNLNVIIFADWFNSTLIKKIQFMDDNTGKLWFPETGGCNIPALNSLLNVFGFAFGDVILNGKFEFGNSIINFSSGSTLIKAPKNAKLGMAKLNDIKNT
uniref:Peptidase S8/S53 domain-containing protein n=1 Tax=Panagrolaimus sp. PS1159 TaxID=55785 RepID=A0AC35G609_9BILA